MKISVITTDLFSRICHWLKERFHKRKVWFLVAVLFFIAEMALLVWPVGWLREDMDSGLSGQGSWNMEHQGNHFSCSQEFRPQYRDLASIGIVVMAEGKLSGGNAVIVVSDSENEVLFRTEVPYEQLTIDAYTDVETNLSLHPWGKSYFLSIYLEPDENGQIPI